MLKVIGTTGTSLKPSGFVLSTECASAPTTGSTGTGSTESSNE